MTNNNEVAEQINRLISSLSNCNYHDQVCPSCWQSFEYDYGKHKKFLEHHCVLSYEERLVFIENVSKDKLIYSTCDQVFRDHLREIANSFSTSQKHAATLAIEGTSNIWIYGSAGVGKTFVLDWIIKYLKAKSGSQIIFVCEKSKSSNYIMYEKGKQSLFKVANSVIDISKFDIHVRGERLKYEVKMCTLHYFSKEEFISPIILAKHVALDDAVLMNLDLHEFLDELFKQIRDSNQYFGGLRVIFTGDTLQNQAYILDGFFQSKIFHQEGKFKIILLNNHEKSRFTNEEWFQFISRCRTGNLTVNDFNYITDSSKIGNRLNENEKYWIRSLALKANKELLTTHNDVKFDSQRQSIILNSGLKWRIDNPHLTGMIRSRIMYLLSYQDDVKMEEFLSNNKKFSDTVFIVTELEQVSKYFDYNQNLSIINENSNHNKNCDSKELLITSEMVQNVLGLTFSDCKICFDNSRGSSNGTSFYCLARIPSPEKLIFVHEIKSLEELKLSFLSNPIASKLDEYILNEYEKERSCVIEVDFSYDDSNKNFKKYNLK